MEFIIKMVQLNSRRDGCGAKLGVEAQQLVQMTARVQHDGFIYRLSGLGTASASRQNWEALFASQGNSGFNVVGVLRKGYADRFDLVNRGVSGVASARKSVKQDLTAHGVGQPGSQRRITDSALHSLPLYTFACKITKSLSEIAECTVDESAA